VSSDCFWFTVTIYYCYANSVFIHNAHGTQNILLTHVLVCWFSVSVLVLVLSLTVLVLSLTVLVLVMVLVMFLITVLLPSPHVTWPWLILEPKRTRRKIAFFFRPMFICEKTNRLVELSEQLQWCSYWESGYELSRDTKLSPTTWPINTLIHHHSCQTWQNNNNNNNNNNNCLTWRWDEW